MNNKKIINATSVTYDGINFKSKLEVATYKLLKEAGLNPFYEPHRYVLINGFKPKVPFYNKNKKNKNLTLANRKALPITYSPDFEVSNNKITAIIEVKGIENDVFPVKKKLFRRLLETLPGNYVYFEVYNKKNVLQAINIIKEYGKQNTESSENSK